MSRSPTLRALSEALGETTLAATSRSLHGGARKATEGDPMIPESRSHILKSNGLAHLATLGADREVQSTPVWFDWDGERLVMNTNKWRTKYRNMKRHPRVAVSIADPDEPLHYLELRGDVEMEDDPDLAVINSLSRKYMGQDYAFLRPGEERVTVRLRPDHVTRQ